MTNDEYIKKWIHSQNIWIIESIFRLFAMNEEEKTRVKNRLHRIDVDLKAIIEQLYQYNEEMNELLDPEHGINSGIFGDTNEAETRVDKLIDVMQDASVSLTNISNRIYDIAKVTFDANKNDD